MTRTNETVGTTPDGRDVAFLIARQRALIWSAGEGWHHGAPMRPVLDTRGRLRLVPTTERTDNDE